MSIRFPFQTVFVRLCSAALRNPTCLSPHLDYNSSSLEFEERINGELLSLLFR